jgi:hypothetical protein
LKDELEAPLQQLTLLTVVVKGISEQRGSATIAQLIFTKRLRRAFDKGH